MRDLLRIANRSVLETVATGRSLLTFDFDGTLSPIVASRGSARLRASTRGLLRRLSALYPVAIISGRAQADVARRVRGLGVKYVVGSHGLEPFAASAASIAALNEARTALSGLVRRIPGLEVEDKRYSLAVHYRRVRHGARARTAILASVEGLPSPVRATGGKRVVNVVPANSPNKGDAVLALGRRERARHVLFLGDDVTDEDVFRLVDERLVLVRVGRSTRSSAAFFVRNQVAVDALLGHLIAFREKAVR